MQSIYKNVINYFMKELKKEETQSFLKENFIEPATNYILEKIYPFIILSITIIFLIIIMIFSILYLILTKNNS